MNISYRWLQSLAPSITESPRELADRLGMLGAPVDELTELSAEIGDVLIARVAQVRPHPNADRLRVCTVEAGGEPLQVVCGAPNVEAGCFYPFAPVGATLPGGVEIRKAKLRGEVSEGMLCSARELGLGRDHGGLMTLAGEYPPGSRLVEQLELQDARLVVDVTANRPDLLSHLGVARELAPGGVDALQLRPFRDDGAELELRRAERSGEVGGVRVEIEDEAGCPRYLAAVIRGVRVGPSPEWLATRLRAVGLRPINNVVDATNYVLHELGQPLHAFDLARIAGPEIRVRAPRDGESIRTLDGVDRSLSPDALVIADARGPVALAGVMGGEESEVGDETRDVLLECARFDPLRVRRTARRHTLSTDASYRFERGVDPELQPAALRRVVDLILAIAGGTPEPVALDLEPASFRRTEVELRPERVSRLLGVEIDGEEVAALLRPIGFETHAADGVLRVRVPGFRPDVTREVDLVEEVARRRGYDSFPEELRPFRPSRAAEDPFMAVQREVRALFLRWGFLEARTAGFAPDREGRVPLLNPLSAEESHLRDALAPGLLRRVEYNWARGARAVRLFEIGTVFFPAQGELPAREELRVAAAFTGPRLPPHWSGEAPPLDLWDARALLEQLARAIRVGVVSQAGAAGLAMTGGELLGDQSFTLVEGGAVQGCAGRARDEVVDAPAWADPVLVLEATLPARLAPRAVEYAALPEFPAVERDLALLVPDAVPAARVEEVIRGAAGPLLEAVYPFDLYAGKGIPAGTRSLAWRLRFRKPDSTLTDAEVDPTVERVLRALDEDLDVRRR